MTAVQHIPRKELSQFSENDLEFIYDQSKLKDFIGLPFSMANIEKQIELKKDSFDIKSRDQLVNVLQTQYLDVRQNDDALSQINRLKEPDTFSVTTGHQLCLLGGPMYFFIKIIHVIKLTEILNEKYPKNHFVPVFWMASEDHDSEEINHLHLFNKRVQWDHGQTGAVGRFKNEGLQEIFEDITNLFSESRQEELMHVFHSFQGKTYGAAFRNWLNDIFSEKGLVIIDGDDRELKSMFGPIMKRELTQNFSNEIIQKTNQNLKAIGRKIQVHSRDINLFGLSEGSRNRIIKSDQHFLIDEKKYSREELLTKLANDPYMFSPNAILRPLYQECILPNLCYVGGMAEMNYWAQLKGIFEESEIPYPLLQFRSNVLWIDRPTKKRMESLGLDIKEFFIDTELIIQKYVDKTDANPLKEEELEEGLAQIEMGFLKASDEQKHLHPWIGAELNKMKKAVAHIKSKILKEKKKSQEENLLKIQKIKETLFPSKQLQERHQNLLHFCNANSYQSVIDNLYEGIDPLNDGFTIISEI